jgi:NADH-quinone oxidoreductase subunit L
MTVPLIVLAVCSVSVAWGRPIWNPEASWLEHQIHHSQPVSVMADFGVPGIEGETWEGGGDQHARLPKSERYHAHRLHSSAGGLALLMVALGLVFAALLYYYKVLDPAEAQEQFPRVHAFLTHKWYFDELYSVMLVRPALVVAQWCKWFDLNVIDGVLHFVARTTVRVSRWDGRFDNGVVDGLVNLVGNATHSIGAGLRGVQTGSLRNYVLFLVLAAVGIFVLLSYFVTMAAAG